MFTALAPLVLASTSPRRQQFLADLGLVFECISPASDNEPIPVKNEQPQAYTNRVAQFKAEACLMVLAAQADRYRAVAPVVIAADTSVFCDNEILGKPINKQDALRMITVLNGKTHTVVTSCCVASCKDGRGVATDMYATETFFESTEVTFAKFPLNVLQVYVNTEEGADKAGSYAIQGQGAFLIKKVQGSLTNVIGLPLTGLVTVLLKKGLIRTK